MKASVGDRLLEESPTDDTCRRDGDIVGPNHADGTPPYDVRRPEPGGVAAVSRPGRPRPPLREPRPRAT